MATAGTTRETVISITDDDVPSVVASFAQDAYTVAEGSSVTVTVELDQAPERQVVIPLTAANQDGATLGGLRHPARQRHLRGHRYGEDVHLHGHRRQCRRRRGERQVHLWRPAHRGQRRFHERGDRQHHR